MKVNGGVRKGAFVVPTAGVALRRNLTDVSSAPDHTQEPSARVAGLSQRKGPFLMSVIFLLIAASTLVAAVFLAAFVRAVRRGQYDDDRSPAVRMLHDDLPRSTSPLPLSGLNASLSPGAGAMHLTPSPSSMEREEMHFTTTPSPTNKGSIH